jgi:hypothetical protein
MDTTVEENKCRKEDDKNFYTKLCIYGGTCVGCLVRTSVLGFLSPFMPIDIETLLITSLSFSFFGFFGGAMIANICGFVSIDPHKVQQAVENVRRDANERYFKQTVEYNMGFRRHKPYITDF